MLKHAVYQTTIWLPHCALALAFEQVSINDHAIISISECFSKGILGVQTEKQQREYTALSDTTLHHYVPCHLSFNFHCSIFLSVQVASFRNISWLNVFVYQHLYQLAVFPIINETSRCIYVQLILSSPRYMHTEQCIPDSKFSPEPK